MRLTRDVEFRAVKNEDSDGYRFEGYATVFGVETQIRSWEGDFVEQMAKGAFKKTLRERKPIMQFNHGRDIRTGTVPVGKFDEIREDDHGLYVGGSYFRNDLVEPIREATEHGALSGMSISFSVVRDEWRDNKGKLVRADELNKLLWEPGDRGPLKRTIKEAKLYEAGPVVNPAYQTTSIGLRTADSEPLERAEVVDLYRKTMQRDDEDQDLDALAAWLNAERTWQWLEAERTYRWLEVETAWRATQTSTTGAAPEGTPAAGKPESDAAHAGTSHRESTQKVPERKAPESQRKRVMTLQELRQRLIELEARQEELGDEFRDVEMPDATQKEWDDNEAERAKVQKSIERIEARMEAVKGLALDGKVERGTDPGRPQRKAPENIYDVREIRNQAYGEEDFSRLLRDNAMRASEKARFGGHADKAKAQENIERLLDNVEDPEDRSLSRRLLETGSPTYERAWSKTVAAGTPQALEGEEFRALSLGADGSGGFAVPFQLDPTIIWTSAGVISPLRQIARVEQIVGKEWQGVISSGTSVSRDNEAEEVSDDSFSLTQPTVRTKRVQGFVPFSYELAESWNQVRNEITFALTDAKGREEGTSFVTGDGSTGNQPGGIVGSLSGNTVNAPGQAVSAGAIYALEDALDPRWRHSGTKFLANKAIYNKIRQLDTAGGANLWAYIGGGQPSQLLGYDVYEASAMGSATTTGAKFLLFGDFSQFLIVDRVGMSVELIPQIFGANGRPTGQRGVYAVWMNNSKILVPAAFKISIGAA